MGEMADDYTNGRVCNFCECYFTEAHGYPVLCDDCWEGADEADKEGLSKTIHPEI